ncbi:amino-acid N-acetyltransferase, partial [Vibrio parahaemolyticus V-223/04]
SWRAQSKFVKLVLMTSAVFWN